MQVPWTPLPLQYRPPWVSIAMFWWVLGNPKSGNLLIRRKLFRYYCWKFIAPQNDALLSLRKRRNRKISSKDQGKIDGNSGKIAAAAVQIGYRKIWRLRSPVLHVPREGATVLVAPPLRLARPPLRSAREAAASGKEETGATGLPRGGGDERWLTVVRRAGVRRAVGHSQRNAPLPRCRPH